MKRTFLSLLLAVPLLLAGCSPTPVGSTAGMTPEDPDPGIADESTPTEAPEKLSDVSEGIDGRVGYRHGLDCEDIDNCSVHFTVESLAEIAGCDSHATAAQPPGTRLVKASVLVETFRTDSDYDPGAFPIWADWSALTAEGLNQALPSSSWCHNTDREQDWMESLFAGDTERRVHYMDVPEDTTHIRLTETVSDVRWEFPAP